MEYTTVEKIGGMKKALEKCKELVLENMETSGLIKEWDFGKTKLDITPEEHFNNIVNWCRENIKSHVWSHHASSKDGFQTSYGAKHKCEKELRCYVANNWMKLAMIYAGLEVCNVNMVDYETGKVLVYPVYLHDILTNTENFIVRNKRKEPGIQYHCLNEDLVENELKYREGGYNGPCW